MNMHLTISLGKTGRFSHMCGCGLLLCFTAAVVVVVCGRSARKSLLGRRRSSVGRRLSGFGAGGYDANADQARA